MKNSPFVGLLVQRHSGLLCISVDQSGGERQTISLTAWKRKKTRYEVIPLGMRPEKSVLWDSFFVPSPGKDGQQPVLLLVSKDLSDVLPETQREAVFIRARSKNWSSERLCQMPQKEKWFNCHKPACFTSSLNEGKCVLTYGGSVFAYQPQVVAEEGQNTDAEHGRHKKKKQDVEFGVSVLQLILERRQEETTAVNNPFDRTFTATGGEMRGGARGVNRVTACTPP